MAKKTKRRRGGSRKARKARPASRSGWRLLAGLLVLGALLAGGYTLYLAKTVRVKFEGKRWALPAQIYARPLELYAGASVSAAQLKAELRFLGYREVGKVSGPAQWAVNGGGSPSTLVTFGSGMAQSPVRQLWCGFRRRESTVSEACRVAAKST